MPSRFLTTVWDLVGRAQRDSPRAVSLMVDRYRPPVVRFLRVNGFDEHTAEDLSQEVLKRVFVDGVLAKADPSRGRFRGLLLGVTRRVASEEVRRRRAAKRRPVTLPVPSDRDEVFDRLWLENLLEIAVERLRERSHRHDVPYAEALDMHARGERPYSEIAGRFGASEAVARNWVLRARKIVAAEVRRLMREYSSSKEDYEEEMRYLERFMA
ncbi:MAG: hypothetical protein HYY17_08290 [Planctomycetes bacterium]|nr:hypothetical protein [Planctomycetota bacterium]